MLSITTHGPVGPGDSLNTYSAKLESVLSAQCRLTAVGAIPSYQIVSASAGTASREREGKGPDCVNVNPVASIAPIMIRSESMQAKGIRPNRESLGVLCESEDKRCLTLAIELYPKRMTRIY